MTTIENHPTVDTTVFAAACPLPPNHELLHFDLPGLGRRPPLSLRMTDHGYHYRSRAQYAIAAWDPETAPDARRRHHGQRSKLQPAFYRDARDPGARPDAAVGAQRLRSHGRTRPVGAKGLRAAPHPAAVGHAQPAVFAPQSSVQFGGLYFKIFLTPSTCNVRDAGPGGRKMLSAARHPAQSGGSGTRRRPGRHAAAPLVRQGRRIASRPASRRGRVRRSAGSAGHGGRPRPRSSGGAPAARRISAGPYAHPAVRRTDHGRSRGAEPHSASIRSARPARPGTPAQADQPRAGHLRGHHQDPY
ncbi:hypothetical protein CDEF62S_02868 [Castellaniella defragrans]